MMKCFIKRTAKKGQRGQTLLLAMLAIVILAAAIVFLFDLQNIIRGKVKAQIAADAAALTGAKWQANSLNVIGELNLLKACTAIITDMPETASGKYSDSPLWAPNAYVDSNGGLHGDLLRLKECSDLLSQMQVRASFVGPLIGFGAAQQAAKNNGLTYSPYWSNVLARKYEYLAGDLGDIYYGGDVVEHQTLYGYSWRGPYAEMLRNVLQLGSSGGVATGVAVNMNSDWVSDPDLISDSDIFNNYLKQRATYKAINGSYWCALRYLLRENFGSSSKWWGNIELVFHENNFRYESELIPLKVLHTYSGENIYHQAENAKAFYGSDSANGIIMDNYNAPDGYERHSDTKLIGTVYDDEDPYLCDSSGALIYNSDGNRVVYNAVKYDIAKNETTGINELYYLDSDGNPVYTGLYTKDGDECWAPLPRISWTIYDTDYWNSYPTEDSYYWQHSWAEFLRSDFQDGYRYNGAVSWAGITLKPSVMSNAWNRLDSENDDSDYSYIGEALQFGNEASAGGRAVNDYAGRMKSAEAAMRYENIKTEVKSLAKPYGRIPIENGEYLTPCTILMVLPVFDAAKLIPIDLEEPTNVTPDPEWAAFKAEYLPVLGTVDELDDMPDTLKARFYYYHNALKTLDDPEWRQKGLDWLTTVNESTGSTNEASCDYWPSGGTQPRMAPSTPF